MANVFKGRHGLRAGWRLLIFFAMFAALGFAATKISDTLMHGKQPDPASPVVGIVMFAVLCACVLFPAWVMGRIEGRTLGDYGLPLRGALGAKFWATATLGFASLSLLLAALRVIQDYFAGSVQLHGAEILKEAVLWAIAIGLAAVFEEFFYRGYMQYTLTTGIGFWPAAVVTSALMGVAHVMNPGWTWLGLVTVFLFGLLACLLLRRTGNLWAPIGLHLGWNWGEVFFYGIPCSGLMGHGHLLQGTFRGSPSVTGMPFGVEAGWPNLIVFGVWWWIFARWFRGVRYGGAPTKG